jgi:hypothetical protein
MKSLEIPNLPDEVYQHIEELARVRGKPVGELAAEMLSDAVAGDDIEEATLLAEIRAEREQMAREGILLTPEDVQRAKQWGRE